MARPAHDLSPASAADDELAIEPWLPEYGGACLSEVVPALIRLIEGDGEAEVPGWLPALLGDARQIVLLVLDGLGYDLLRASSRHAPTLDDLDGGAITSVAPTTTATALTSLATGTSPAQHGVLGYRLRVGGEILNILKWATASGDARQLVPPLAFQPQRAFLGRRVPVVSRAEFAGSGFTEAHLEGAPLIGWRVPSGLGVEVRRLLTQGERLIYAYYDGIDRVAHDKGLGEHFAAELRAVDRLVAELIAELPSGGALAVVTVDHGQVEVPDAAITLDPAISAEVELLSGEGRFRWLHTRRGATEHVAAACQERYGELAWVHTRDELVDAGWFGGVLGEGFADRLGDVALVARAPVAFADPSDAGEASLVARHGSLTRAEMLVPLLAGGR